MKYTIETTETGCKETLSFTDSVYGEVTLERNHVTKNYGESSCTDKSFAEAMREMDICEELVEQVDDCLDQFFPHEFMMLARDFAE